METMCDTKINNKVKKKTSLSYCFSIPSKGNNEGLMLLWNDTLNVLISSFFLGHIDALNRDDSGI